MAEKLKIYKWLIISIAVISLSIAAVKGLCHYEDIEDPWLDILSRGTFTGRPQVMPGTFGMMVGSGYLVKQLYETLPSIDWYAISILIAYALLIYLLIDIAFILRPKAIRIFGAYSTAVLALIFFIAIGTNFLLWQFTRLSLLLSGLALFGFWLEVKENGIADKIRWPKLILCLFCLAYAAMLRVEPATLSIAICLPLLLLSYIQSFSLKKLLPFFLPLAVIGIFSVAVNMPVTKADQGYMALRKYQFTAFDFKQESGIHLSDAKDSVIYKAFSRVLWSDPANITPAFLQCIGLEPRDKTPSAIPYYFHNLVPIKDKLQMEARKFYGLGSGAILLSLIVSLYGIYLFARFNSSKLKWFLLLQVWEAGLFFGITILMKFEMRGMAPMALCFILQNVVWLIYLIPVDQNPKVSLSAAFVFLALSLPCIGYESMAAFKLHRALAEDQKRVRKLESLLQTKSQSIVLMGLKIMVGLKQVPFQREFNFGGKRPVSLDNYIDFLLQGYDPYMRSIFGTSQFNEVINQLRKRKNDVLVVDTPERKDLLEEYVRVIYGIPLSFNLVQLVDSSSASATPYSRAAGIYQIN